MWTTAGPSSYQTSKCTIQALMISGRYRTEQLSSHWAEDKSSFCKTPSCKDRNIIEDLDHILTTCESLEPTRRRLLAFTADYCQSLPFLQPITSVLHTPSSPAFCQFLIDCSVLPTVIAATQLLGQEVLHHLFRITRTWCYSLHRDRLKILGRWKKF